MLSFNNLELVLGGKTLFDDVSLTIHHQQKVGLVGANGTGKTSLFKVIKNEIEVDQSSVNFPSDLRISYLAQEVPGSDEISLDYVLSGDYKLIEIQKDPHLPPHKWSITIPHPFAREFVMLTRRATR